MSSIFLGSSFPPLVLIEVVPIVLPGFHPESALPSLSAPFVKMQLLRQALRSNLAPPDAKNNSDLMIVWDETTPSTKILQKGILAVFDDTNTFPRLCALKSHHNIPLIYLSSQDPTLLKPWPCFIVGFCAWRPPNDSSSSALVTDATLVRILPLQIAESVSPSPILFSPLETWSDHRARADQWRNSFMGELDNSAVLPELLDEVLHNHESETVDALSLRMSSLLSKTVYIGTTKDAFALRQKWNKRRQSIRRGLDCIGAIESSDVNENQLADNSITSLLAEGSLIVYSRDHAAGKTLLVQSIARHRLNCLVHLIHPGPLMAKYGVQADAALESLLHTIVVSAAAVDKPICIILDQMDVILPPSLSGRSGAGDAAVPALNGIASVLKNVSLSLKNRSQYPFPTKHFMYNVGGKGGIVLPVRVCLVGVVTCTNDVGRFRRGGNQNLVSILDSMTGGRFSLPPLSASARVRAFQYSFDRYNIQLTEEAAVRLPFIAASSSWARGASFQTVARQLRAILETKTRGATNETWLATLQDVEQAVALLRTDATRSSNITFARESKMLGGKGMDVFESVGGNVKAKRALEDALALDPKVAQQLASFGMSPPIGVLLYGPPGCGKTLLAKSVAALLQSNLGPSTALGGAFISLSASTIVRAEVGTSEKLVVASFETARANAPAVIFIDEFQALFTDRQGIGSGRLSSTLLQCLDDVKLWSEVDHEANERCDLPSASKRTGVAESNHILVLGATNTPWLVDKAFLRPGRFDRVVHVGLPTLSERRAIIRVHIGRMRTAFSKASTEFESLCAIIASKTDGFSGADLAAVCRAAAVRCLTEAGESGSVEEKHFLEALDEGNVRPSSNDNLVARLDKWHPQQSQN